MITHSAMEVDTTFQHMPPRSPSGGTKPATAQQKNNALLGQSQVDDPFVVSEEALRIYRSTTYKAVFAAARKYVATGLSVIPIATDGSKGPDWQRLPYEPDATLKQMRQSWSRYQVFRPTKQELRKWFMSSGYFGPYRPGLAVVCGKVSGNLEVIDFDTIDLFEPWAKLVEQKCPGLLQKLVRVRTPRPGMHVYYRSNIATGNEKLACSIATNPETGKSEKKALIEKKGEGGYCLAPPSPAVCHRTGRLYQLSTGSPPLTSIPTISWQERRILTSASKTFDECFNDQQKAVSTSKPREPGGGRPGDDFNSRASWEEVLEPHGWAYAGPSGDEQRWRRPGKDEGISATVNYQGNDMLHVFSSNADPFEQDQSYSKFAAYTLLNHEGDYQAAASELREQGYGTRPLTMIGGAKVKEGCK